MFRNREIKQFGIVFIIITIISAIAGIVIHPAVFLLVFFSAAAYGMGAKHNGKILERKIR